MATKVLVTGAGGFIGSHLAEHLATEGYDVRALVHYNSANHWFHLQRLPEAALRSIEVMPGDVADAALVERAVAGCQIVFHLAALIGIPYSYHAPNSYVATNVTGTLNVLQACLRHGARLVHTSTSEVYGTAQYVPMDEEHPLVAQSPYAATKIAGDKLVESFCRSFELSGCVVRPFNTFGPRQSARAVIPTIIVQALSGEAVRLGSLEPVRDLTYVADTVAGFVAAGRSDVPRGEVINLGTGEGWSIAQVVQEVGRLLGRDLKAVEEPARVRPSESEVLKLVSNNSKAGRLLSWRPKVSLRDGLAATIQYLSEHVSEYKADRYNV